MKRNMSKDIINEMANNLDADGLRLMIDHLLEHLAHAKRVEYIKWVASKGYWHEALKRSLLAVGNLEENDDFYGDNTEYNEYVNNL